MIATIVNILFSLLFLSFAYFNLNDSDGWLWVLIYLATAALCALAALKKFYPKITLAYIVVLLFYAGYFFISKDGVMDWIREYDTPSITESMQATKPYIEKTREFFGLLIAIAALAVNYFFRK
ncbi:MAG: transmembrane 220 family protein [Chitinophagaceae bacterium]